MCCISIQACLYRNVMRPVKIISQQVNLVGYVECLGHGHTVGIVMPAFSIVTWSMGNVYTDHTTFSL